MPIVLDLNRVLVTTTTTGTGSFTIDSTVTGFRSIVTADGNSFWYSAWSVNASGTPTGEWEYGYGTRTSGTVIARTSVLKNSTGGSGALNFSAGTKYIAVTLLSDRVVQMTEERVSIIPRRLNPPGDILTEGAYFSSVPVASQESLFFRNASTANSDRYFQETIGYERFVKYSGGQATINAIGGGALTAITAGTAVTPDFTGSILINRIPRTQYATTAQANNINALYSNALTTSTNVYRNNANTGWGGFRLIMRFRLSATQVNSRFFAGLRDVVSAPTNVDPFTSTTPGAVGIVANLATSANWRIAHNISGTAPTTIDLGASYNVSTDDIVELTLFSPPYTSGTPSINYRVAKYSGLAVLAGATEGTLTTNLPAVNTFLNPTIWMVNVTAAVASFQVVSITLESFW